MSWKMRTMLGVLLAVSTAAPSLAASWEFHSTPVTNSCTWSLWPVGCSPWFWPAGGVSVFTCSTSLIVGLDPGTLVIYLFVPSVGLIVEPPRACAFDACSPTSLTVRCVDPRDGSNQEFVGSRLDAEAIQKIDAEIRKLTPPASLLPQKENSQP